MKKLRIIALLSILAFISADSFAQISNQDFRSDKQQRQMEKKKRTGQKIEKYKTKAIQPRPGKPTGAPIDGGLLLILGAAGATYFGVKKKKRNSNEG